MRSELVDAAIESCERHLSQTGAFSSEIENFLVEYLLVLLYAEYEKTAKLLLQKRAEQSGDSELASFVKSASKKLVRSIKISDMAGLLGNKCE